MISNSYIRKIFQAHSSGPLVALTMTTLALQSCTHGNGEIAEELARTPVTTQAELKEQEESSIESMPGLDATQRARLLEIRNSANTRADVLQLESLQVRSLIIKEVMNAGYDPNKVDRLRKRLRKVENERLNLTFNSIEEANKILGRETEPDRRRKVFEVLVGPPPRNLKAQVE